MKDPDLSKNNFEKEWVGGLTVWFQDLLQHDRNQGNVVLKRVREISGIEESLEIDSYVYDQLTFFWQRCQGSSIVEMIIFSSATWTIE